MIVAPPPSFVFTAFNDRDSDGFATRKLCNWSTHIEIDGRTNELLHISRCDNESCLEQESVEITRLIADMRKERFMDAPGVFFDSEVVIDDGLKAILKKRAKFPPPFNRHLIGYVFASSYAKRHGSSRTLHVNYDLNVHVTVETAFTWMTRAKADVYQSHKLSVAPCDGSCRRTLNVTPELIIKLAEFEHANP